MGLSRDDHRLIEDIGVMLDHIRKNTETIGQYVAEMEERWVTLDELCHEQAEENARLQARVLELETAQSSGMGSHAIERSALKLEVVRRRKEK